MLWSIENPELDFAPGALMLINFIGFIMNTRILPAYIISIACLIAALSNIYAQLIFTLPLPVPQTRPGWDITSSIYNIKAYKSANNYIQQKPDLERPYLVAENTLSDRTASVQVTGYGFTKTSLYPYVTYSAAPSFGSGNHYQYIILGDDFQPVQVPLIFKFSAVITGPNFRNQARVFANALSSIKTTTGTYEMLIQSGYLYDKRFPGEIIMQAFTSPEPIGVSLSTPSFVDSVTVTAISLAIDPAFKLLHPELYVVASEPFLNDPPLRTDERFDVQVVKAKWSATKGGISFSYKVNKRLSRSMTIRAYWTNGTSGQTKLSSVPFYSESIDLSEIRPESAFVGYIPPENFIDSPPANTASIMLVADEDNILGEANRLNNIFVLKDVQVSNSARPVSSRTIEIVKKLLRYAGGRKGVITSSMRTPLEQAVAMYDNEKAGKSARYGPAGTIVMAEYKLQKAANKTKGEIIAAMVAKINELGPSNVSKHCGDSSILSVIDVSRWVLSQSSQMRFAKRALEMSASTREVSRFLGPFAVPGYNVPFDPVFHLEIPELPLKQGQNDEIMIYSAEKARSVSPEIVNKVTAASTQTTALILSEGKAVLAGSVSNAQSAFLFNAKERDIVYIGLTVTEQSQGSLVNDGDCVMFLLDPSDKVIGTSDFDAEGSYEASFDELVIPQSGVYKLVVTTYGNQPILDNDNRVVAWKESGGGNVKFTVSLALLPSSAISITQVGLGALVNGQTKLAMREIVGSQESEGVFSITNIGNGALEGLAFAIDGPDAGLFTITPSSFEDELQPAESASFTVKFSPLTSGRKNAMLRITSNVRDGATFDIPLEASASAAVAISRITNLSVRTTLGSSQTLIVGTTMQGGAKPVLVRAVGPSLATFGVTGVMTDPRMALFNGNTQIAANDNWGGGGELTTTFTNVGAFPLANNSLDAALLRSIDGGHTMQITGSAAGTVLVEAYDAGTGITSRLTNVSARSRVGREGDILIAGFTIAGNGSKNLLIRAVGPTLASFGVTNALVDPKFEVYAGPSRVAENDTWAASLSSVFASVGAFALAPNSKDAALMLSLLPGGYTVQVSGADGGTGEALVEIYELP